MLRDWARRLQLRALPAVGQDSVMQSEIEDDYEDVDINTPEDFNCSPMDYVVPGPVENTYQTARVEGTEAAKLAWAAAQDAYELYLREHVEMAAEKLHDAARAAAMAAAAQATRSLLTALGTANAMQGCSLSQALTIAFTRTRIGNDLYQALDRYRYRRQQQIQAVRDRAAVAFFRYEIKDKLTEERQASALSSLSSEVVENNNRGQPSLNSPPPSSLSPSTSDELPETRRQHRDSNRGLDQGQHSPPDAPIASWMDKLSINAATTASPSQGPNAAGILPSPADTIPLSSPQALENNDSSSAHLDTPTDAFEDTSEQVSSSASSPNPCGKVSQIKAVPIQAIDFQDDAREFEDCDLDDIFGMYKHYGIGSQAAAVKVDAEKAEGEIAEGQVDANARAEKPAGQVEQVPDGGYSEIMEELKAKFRHQNEEQYDNCD